MSAIEVAERLSPERALRTAPFPLLDTFSRCKQMTLDVGERRTNIGRRG